MRTSDRAGRGRRRVGAGLVVLLSSLTLGVCPSMAAEGGAEIRFEGRAPEGLVGNGSAVVRVMADHFEFHTGGDARGSLKFVVGGRAIDPAGRITRSRFFPGGIIHELAIGGGTIDLLYGALPEHPFLVAIRATGADSVEAIELASTGAPGLAPVGRIPLPGGRGRAEVVLVAGGVPPTASWEELLRQVRAPYETGLRLRTPSPLVDRAVPFCRYLLDLGFDGRLHVCEIFRWRDVWSRDLGSGLVPGAMASGRFEAARRTIAYDLARHAASDPRGLKVTQDPSQGGSAEGVAWLTRAVWKDYLLSGDRAALRDAAAILRPWKEAWLDRDPDNRGLLIDVTEWMDHSRFFLFPDGARVLYSNVLFAGLLRRFATIDSVLGDTAAAHRDAAAADRFVAGINDGLWNETAGHYDNLVLWGRRDERISSAENALAILEGVAPGDRAGRALAAVEATNWRAAGSTTIYPPMTHVPDYIDHNFRMWPWWNAVEARARFRCDDRAGAVHLLECCSRTLDDEALPGLIEELTTPEGKSEGGHAFLTAAGSYLDAIVEGLLGVEIVTPGCARLRVAPNTPVDWRDWDADVPLPGGSLSLRMKSGRLTVTVTDPRVRVIEVASDVTVVGAEAAPLATRPWPALPPRPAPRPGPPLRSRAAARLVTGLALPAGGLDWPAARVAVGDLAALDVAVEDLAALDAGVIGALIVEGNALPRIAGNGIDVPAALDRFLDAGGALVFYGATMIERGTMGEQGGVIEWYEERPVVDYRPIEGWQLRRSFNSAAVDQAAERGMREGWSNPAAPADADTAWLAAVLPAPWEKRLGYDYDGWGWYRAWFDLPASARGRVVVLDLGRIDDRDWTFVNGRPVGSASDWQRIRHYRLAPGDAAYDALHFGGSNMVAVQVLDTGGGGGLFIDPPRVGVETDRRAWSPIDPKNGEVADHPVRHGVVSWGPGGAFFNSWETSRGAFGFRIEGHGVTFSGPLAGLDTLDVDVREAFTDFAVSRPWCFEPLAFTETRRGWLVPDRGERYPCAARIVNTRTGGEMLLIPASIARTPAGPAILRRLLAGGG